MIDPPQASVFVALILGAVVIVAAMLRLTALTNTPIFLDEDIYSSALRQARDMGFAEGSFFYSSEAHKPFLLSWMATAVWQVVGDYVLAGRLLSAFAGIATTLICYQLGRLVDGPFTGLLCAMLYATSPVAVMHERMFLHDPPMVTCLALAVLASLLSGQRQSWGWAAAAAIAGMCAIQFKQTAILLAPFLPMAVILTSKGGIARRRVMTAALVMTGPALSFLTIYLSSLGQVVSPANTRFTPLVNWQGNLSSLLDFLLTYLTLPLLLFAAVGLVVLLRRPGVRRTSFFLAGAVTMLTLPWILASNFAPSRYFLPAVPFVLVFSSTGIAAAFSACRGRKGILILLPAVLSLAAIVPPAVNSARCVWLLETARLTELDDWQYRSGWPSGYGYREAGQVLRAAARTGKKVGYLIDRQHLNAAGFYESLRERNEAPVLLDPGWSPTGGVQSLVLMVDQPRDARAGAPHAADGIRQGLPGTVEIARFPKPGSDWAIVILRLLPGDGSR